MDSRRVQEVDNLTDSAQIDHSASNSPLQIEDEQEPGPDRSSDWITEDESDMQSGILGLHESTTQDDDEDQWFCTLCDKCKALIKHFVEFYLGSPKRHEESMRRRRWHDINDLKEMHDECDLCRLVFTGLVMRDDSTQYEKLASLSERNALLFAKGNLRYTDNFVLEFLHNDPKYGLNSHFTTSHGFASIEIHGGSDTESLGQARLSSNRTDSHDTIEKIFKWLRKCATHAACGEWCRSVGASRSMPRRLLEIDIESLCHKVRLVLTDGRADETHPYVTLSHCWGGHVPAKLLHHNLEQMRKQIPFDDLPPTFRDAISVTYRLGFRYLWIDALCIIQDSPEDWLAQSKTMADVYANGALNIAATASEDSMGGLFRDRSPGESSAFAARVSKQNIFCHRNVWKEDFRNSPLINRAWVMQERFLAPRVVHFGHQQVHWDCLEVSTSESLPNDFVLQGLNESSDDSKKALTDMTPVHSHRSSRGTIYRLWDHKTEAYSRCVLTVPSDRSVAVLGLTHAFAKLLGLHQDDCFFGMWNTRFVYELMWVTLEAGSEISVRIDGKVPSWSWCSTTGGIFNESWDGLGLAGESHGLWLTLFSVLQLHGFGRDDLSSEPGDSTVKLSGPMFEVTLQCTDSEHRAAIVQLDPHGGTVLVSPFGEQIEVRIHWDDQRESRIKELIKSRLQLLLGVVEKSNEEEEDGYEQIPAFIRAISDEHDYRDKRDVLYRNLKAAAEGTKEYRCLLLIPTEVPAHFERVGYVKVGKDVGED
ncbi:hypothetical protein HII31_08146 [Pseudocercospora fuligena]|uniref:Heterokaryon incompatibility domain-containing protein n=1 Tax=Pseudocercospora fuligena TaxID=685502 RepID=A0A8H6RH48_9PEZI|nr:hypothetical protein HII31_08146 [Pseudocercospora fuligena]